MKKYLYIVLLTFFGCKSNEMILTKDGDDKIFELNKCYYSLKLGVNDKSIEESSFILEIVQPKLKIFEITYSLDELEKHNIGNGLYQIPICDSYGDYTIYIDDISEFASEKDPKGFAFCFFETPINYLTLNRKDLIAKNYKVTRKKLVTPSKLIKRKVSKPPFELQKNQFFLESGKWSPILQTVSRSGGMNLKIVPKIIKRLRELGYKVDDGKKSLDEQVLTALKDFQRKNGLKEGAIDLKTLQLLGIEN